MDEVVKKAIEVVAEQYKKAWLGHITVLCVAPVAILLNRCYTFKERTEINNGDFCLKWIILGRNGD